ncbi:hypothetical protein V6Z11_A13G264400 [Gossypium hirsutum]
MKRPFLLDSDDGKGGVPTPAHRSSKVLMKLGTVGGDGTRRTAEGSVRR